MNVDTYEVRKALYKRFSDHRQYAVAEEVALTTGFSHRRIDMVVVDCYASNGFRIDGIEIKVSKADLRRELQDPEKHVAFFDRIDYYTLACPADILNGMYELIPKNWGVMVISDDGTTRYKRKPLALHEDIDRTIPRGFLASLVRAIQSRQPSEQEIQEAFERGENTAEEKARWKYNSQREYVQRNAEKLEKYERLMHRLSLIRRDDEEKIVEEFEAFRKTDIEFMEKQVRRQAESLITLADNLKVARGAQE